MVATIALALVAVGIALQPSIALYSVLVFLLGCAFSVWALARLTYATEATPPRHRGRVMSMMGGTMRIGQFIGPVLGGLLILPFGLASVFFFQALLAVAASLTLRWRSVPAGRAGPAPCPRTG